MKPVQLIEYNLRNIFHERSYTKCGGEPIPKIDDIKIDEIKIENISGSTV